MSLGRLIIMFIHLGYSLFHFVYLVALVSERRFNSKSWKDTSKIKFQHQLAEASFGVLWVWFHDPASHRCFCAHYSFLGGELFVEITVGRNDYKYDTIGSLKSQEIQHEVSASYDHDLSSPVTDCVRTYPDLPNISDHVDIGVPLFAHWPVVDASPDVKSRVFDPP